MKHSFLAGLLLSSIFVTPALAADYSSHALTREQILDYSHNGAMQSGPTEGRPNDPYAGQWYYNTTYGCPEQYEPNSIGNGNFGWRCGGGEWRVPGQSRGYAVGSAQTSASTLTNLVAVYIPGGILGLYGCVEISWAWSFPGSTNSKTWSANWSNTQGATTGGTGIYSSASTTTNTVLTVSAPVRKLCNNGSAGAQTADAAANSLTGTGTGALAIAPAIDTTIGSWININGLVASGTEYIHVNYVSVKLIIP